LSRWNGRILLTTVLTASALRPCPAADSLTNDLALLPEKPLLWDESLLWDKNLVLRTGLGYNDNILLSASSPHASALVKAGIEMLVFRLPLDGIGVTASVTGDDTRYWKPANGVEGEDAVLASAQARKDLNKDWQAGLELKYLYLDQVVEELIQVGSGPVVQARGHSLEVNPSLRHDFGSNGWAQVEATAAQEWWEAPLDNDWKLGVRLLAGLNYDSGSRLTMEIDWQRIVHSQWQARDADGTDLPNQDLALNRSSVDLKWEHPWDAKRRWKSTTRLAFQYNDDNGGGFYNYYQYHFSQELLFKARRWEVRGSVGAAYYDFPVQTTVLPPLIEDFQPVPAPIHRPTLYLAPLSLKLRIQRNLSKSLSFFAEYERNRLVSNRSDSQYTDNRAGGGLSWEF